MMDIDAVTFKIQYLSETDVILLIPHPDLFWMWGFWRGDFSMRMNSNPIVQGESILGGEPLVRTGLPQVRKVSCYIYCANWLFLFTLRWVVFLMYKRRLLLINIICVHFKKNYVMATLLSFIFLLFRACLVNFGGL
jgi:hypothetical protein